MELQSVLFVPLNVASQTPSEKASPFSGTVSEHYYERLLCHLESKSKLRSWIDVSLYTNKFQFIQINIVTSSLLMESCQKSSHNVRLNLDNWSFWT